MVRTCSGLGAPADGDGLRPQRFGSVPAAGAALNRAYLSVAELAVAAAREGDPALVRQAVLADPNAASSLTPGQIWDLCDELTAAHARFLPRALGGTLDAS